MGLVMFLFLLSVVGVSALYFKRVSAAWDRKSGTKRG